MENTENIIEVPFDVKAPCSGTNTDPANKEIKQILNLL